MVFFDYKLKKMMMFGIAGFIPILTFIFMILFSVDLLMSVITVFLLTIFLVFMGSNVTSNNPFIKAIEQKRVLIFDINSTGIARVFTAEVIDNVANTGIDIKMDTGVVRAYDRSITHLLQTPQKALMWFIKPKATEEAMVEIRLSNEEFKKAAWYHDYLTILFYNSQIGSFVTKPLISEQEKNAMVEYLTLNESRELRNLNNTFLSLMRHTFDLIAERFSGFIKNPVVQLLIVGVVLVVVGYLAWTYLPGLLGGVQGVAGQATSGQLVEPLTKGAGVV